MSRGSSSWGRAWISNERSDRKSGRCNSVIAYAYAALGEKDEAFAFLESALQTRESQVIYLKVNPEADPLRDDPRFGALLRRVGLEK